MNSRSFARGSSSTTLLPGIGKSSAIARPASLTPSRTKLSATISLGGPLLFEALRLAGLLGGLPSAPHRSSGACGSGVRRLKQDPRYPSLQFKKVGSLWSARVRLHYRALATEVEDGYVWF